MQPTACTAHEQGIEREYGELDTVWFMAGSLFKNYPYDVPTEAFSLSLFRQVRAATAASKTGRSRLFPARLTSPVTLCALHEFMWCFALCWKLSMITMVRQRNKEPQEGCQISRCWSCWEQSGQRRNYGVLSLFRMVCWHAILRRVQACAGAQAFAAVQASVVHLQGVPLSKRFALLPLGPPLLTYSSTCKASPGSAATT